MKTMRWILIVALSYGHLAIADATVLFGVPASRLSASSQGADPESLRPDKTQEYVVVIERRDGRYYWVSRENRELIHSIGGAFHLFIDPRGGGYVKVLAINEGKGFPYIEHVTVGLTTITYWGSSRRFEP